MKIESMARLFSVAILLPLLGCMRGTSNQESHTSNVTASYDFTELVGVSEPGAPNEVLRDWHLFYYGKLPNKIFSVSDHEMLNGVFDADEFIWSDSLKSTIQQSQNIRWLRIGQHVDDWGFERVSAMTSLKGLSLQGANLTRANLVSFEKFENLKWLDLSCTGLGKSTLPALSELQVLIMYNVPSGTSLVPNIGQFPKLKAFILTHSNISDLEVKKLVLACPNLEFLNLAFSAEVTASAIEDLAQLKRLKYLQLCETNLAKSQVKLGERAIDELKKLLPECHIDISK